MTSCISYIMTLHTTDVLPFPEKVQSKDDYYQLLQLEIRFLYPARACLHEEFRDSIPVSSQGTSVSNLLKFEIRYLYLARAYLHEEFEDQPL